MVFFSPPKQDLVPKQTFIPKQDFTSNQRVDPKARFDIKARFGLRAQFDPKVRFSPKAEFDPGRGRVLGWVGTGWLGCEIVILGLDPHMRGDQMFNAVIPSYCFPLLVVPGLLKRLC